MEWSGRASLGRWLFFFPLGPEDWEDSCHLESWGARVYYCGLKSVPQKFTPTLNLQCDLIWK